MSGGDGDGGSRVHERSRVMHASSSASSSASPSMEFLKFANHEVIQELMTCTVDELERRALEVEQKLSLVEARSIDEHAKECENLIALKTDVDTCEEILQSMELELGAFADDLGKISSEIRGLQTQSEALKVKAMNRHAAERALGSVIENLTVDPLMIQTLVNGAVEDEDYSRRATELAQKLDVIDNLRRPNARGGATTVLAASDVAPELERLRVKTCEKSWAFLYGQFHALKQPRTNVQLIQENTLAKYEPLVAFLRARGPEVYWEVKSTYVDVMGKVLKTALASYVESLKRVTLPPKAYIALGSKKRSPGGTNEISGVSALSGIFGGGASGAAMSGDDAGEHAELFSLRSRAQTLRDAETGPPFVLHQPSDRVQQEMREYEELFRSAHRLLIDTATFEYAFCEQFWRGEKDMFEKVFAGPLTVYNDFVAQGVATASKDAIGLLIAIRVNAVNRRVMSRRRVPALDAYFDNLNMTLWPKFKHACDEHVKSLEQMKESFEPNPEAPSFIVRRYANFVVALTTVAHSSFESSTVVDDEEVNIATQVDLVLDRMRRALFDCVTNKLCASLRESPKRRSAYLVKTFDFVCTTLSSLADIKDEQTTELATLHFFEEKFLNESAAFVTHTMHERFPELEKLDGDVLFDATLDALSAFHRNWRQSLASTHADCVACFGTSDWRAVELFRRCVTELTTRYTTIVDRGYVAQFGDEKASQLAEYVVTKPTFTLEGNRYTSKSNDRLASQ